MRFLLDTNAIVGLLRSKDTKAAKRVRRERPNDIAIPSIAVHELYYGAFKSARPEYNAGVIDALGFEVLDFNRDDARRAGEVRAHLAARGAQIGPYDGLIAGQALARNLILVTHNVGDFRRVPGLRLEDWDA